MVEERDGEPGCVLIQATCAACGANWHRRADVGERDDEESLEEVEHLLQTGCKGRVTVKKQGYYSDAEMGLRRLETSGDRYARFCTEERGSIRSHALLLDMSSELAAALLFARNEARLEREALGAPADVLMGLGSTLVYGVSSVNIFVMNEQRPVRPISLEIPPEVARDFLLTDLKVGKNSQFTSPGAIPLSSFSSDRFRHLKLDMDILQVAQHFIVSITNINAAARNFQGVLVCRKV